MIHVLTQAVMQQILVVVTKGFYQLQMHIKTFEMTETVTNKIILH